jgi:hypothetical protein
MSATRTSSLHRLLSAAVVLIGVSGCADPGDGPGPSAQDDDGRSRVGEAGVYESDGGGGSGSPGGWADEGPYRDGGWPEDAPGYNPREGCGGNCPEQTPYCDLQSGRCLACRVGDPLYACPATAPICKVDPDNPDDVFANTCVECISQNDCDRLCDPVSGQCVQCFVREDGQSVGCLAGSEGSVCKTSRVPGRNRCVECLQDYDCASSSGGPSCDLEDNRCVGCLEDAHCTDREWPHCGEELVCTGCEGESHCAHLPGTPLCRQDTGACVECLDQEQCADPAASRCDAESGTCVACRDEEDCSHLEGTGVCDVDPDDGGNNRCVQCTGDEYAACGSYEQFVCESLTRTCSTEYVVASAEACDFCVSDAQCEAGMICARNTFGPDQAEVGYFCQWIEGAAGAPGSCSLDGRPFVERVEDAVSIDGQVATICVLAATTCPALADAEFSLPCDPGGDPGEACGHPDFEDGVCLQRGPDDFRCSVPCDSLADCPVGSASCATINQAQVCELW